MIVVSVDGGAFLSILRKKRDGISRNPVKSRLPLTDNTFVSYVKNSKINGFSVLRILPPQKCPTRLSLGFALLSIPSNCATLYLPRSRFKYRYMSLFVFARFSGVAFCLRCGYGTTPALAGSPYIPVGTLSIVRHYFAKLLFSEKIRVYI